MCKYRDTICKIEMKIPKQAQTAADNIWPVYELLLLCTLRDGGVRTWRRLRTFHSSSLSPSGVSSPRSLWKCLWNLYVLIRISPVQCINNNLSYYIGPKLYGSFSKVICHGLPEGGSIPYACIVTASTTQLVIILAGQILLKRSRPQSKSNTDSSLSHDRTFTRSGL